MQKDCSSSMFGNEFLMSARQWPDQSCPSVHSTQDGAQYALDAEAAAPMQFDFDAWAALAKRDPEAFERQREQAVEQACAELGGRDKPNIAGILWRIEMTRQRTSNPLHLCIKLSSMMWARYFDMDEFMSRTDLGLRRICWEKDRVSQLLSQQSLKQGDA